MPQAALIGYVLACCIVRRSIVLNSGTAAFADLRRELSGTSVLVRHVDLHFGLGFWTSSLKCPRVPGSQC